MPVELEWETAAACATELAQAGRAIAAAGFDEAAVCSFYGVPIPSDAQHVAPPGGRVRKGLGALIALLVGGEVVERRAVPMLEAEALPPLLDVGLLVLSGPTLVPRASITPFRGGLVAADRLDDHAAAAVRPPDLSAWNVAATLPPSLPSLLDTGCGAGAILVAAARRGARVRGTDVDERALAFARLNLSLNGLDPDVAVVQFADLLDGLPDTGAPFSCAVFNAPLVRAPLAVDTPLYLYAPGAEALPLRFLAEVRKLVPAGEVLCHTQLTEEIWRAAQGSGFAQVVALHFATAPDGTPHVLLSLREGEPRCSARFRAPLGAALPHLLREPLDRLHAAAALLATDDERAFAAATVRPAPWLQLVYHHVHDGHAFRRRSLQLGAHRLDPEDLALLERCDGRSLAEAAPDEAGRDRARSLLGLGLLVP